MINISYNKNRLFCQTLISFYDFRILLIIINGFFCQRLKLSKTTEKSFYKILGYNSKEYS